MLKLARIVALRRLRLRPGRLFLTVLSIAFGVASVVGVDLVGRAVRASLEKTVAAIAGKAELEVSGSSAGIPEETVERVRAVAGVAHAAPVLELGATYRGRLPERLQIVGVDMLGDTFFHDDMLQEGDATAEIEDPLVFLNTPNALLLAEPFARRHGIRRGQTVPLSTPDGVKPFRVMGLLHPRGPALAYAGAVAVMDVMSMQVAFGRERRVGRVLVACQPGRASHVERALRRTLGPDYEVGRPGLRAGALEGLLGAVRGALSLAAFLTFLTGGVLVQSAMRTSVAERRTELGVLRALGATRRQVLGLVLAEAAALGLLGGVSGALLGLGLGRGLVEVVSSFVSDLAVRVAPEDAPVDPAVVALGIGIGLVVSLATAVPAALGSLRIEPIEALRATPPANADAGPPGGRGVVAVALVGLAVAAVAASLGGTAPLESSLAASAFLLSAALLAIGPALRLLARPFDGRGRGSALALAFRLAVDDLARRDRRSVTPVVVATLSVALGVAIATVVVSVRATFDAWLRDSVPADLFVTASSPTVGPRSTPVAADVLATVRSLPGVAAAEGQRFLPVTLRGGSRVARWTAFAAGVEPAVYGSYARPELLAGGSLPDVRRALSRGEVVVTENLAAMAGVVLGQRVELATAEGRRRFRVAGIVRDYSSDQGLVAIDRALLSRVFRDDLIDVMPVYLRPGVSPERVRRAILRALPERDLVVQTHTQLRAEIGRLVSQGLGVMAALEALALLLAALAIAGSLTTMVVDRARELALLAAVGATRGQLGRLVIGQGTVVSLAGCALGVPLGLVLGAVAVLVVARAGTGWVLTLSVPWAPLALVVPAAIVVGALAGVVPARRAAGTRALDVLRGE